MPRNLSARSGAVIRIGMFSVLAIGLIGALGMIVTPGIWGSGASHASVPPPDRAGSSTSFVHHFGGAHDPVRWFKSDFYYPNSGHPAWTKDMVHFKPNRLELEVRRQKVAYKNITGGEYQRLGFYHYGRFEVVMRAAPGSGTVSAMFTHTHGQFGDPHDEIDIEFLGKDLTEMHANYFTNGRAHGGIYIPLGFDASKETHLYAFEWEPDEIRWYVDDRLVHTATPEDMAIPQAPGRLIVHAWSGAPEQYDWHGEPTFKNGTRARFYCLSYQAPGDRTPQCSDSFKSTKRRN
jgi:endo-1,3-1,4-beta-glycanase ExoK